MKLTRTPSRVLAERPLRLAMAATALALLPPSAAGQGQAWLRQFGTGFHEETLAAAPDSSGGVYLGGWTWGGLGSAHVGKEDVWLARYDGAGSRVWIRQFGTTAADIAHAAAPDGSGGTYLAGVTGADLGGPSAGVEDAWLARYDGAGNRLWIRQFGTSSIDEALTVAPDGSGGVFVGGYTGGNLGGPSAGGRDAWLARYDGAGNRLWMRQFGSSDWDLSTAVAADGSGGVYVAGNEYSFFYASSWLASYDGSGNRRWIRVFDTGSTVDIDYAYTAAPDGSGGVYVGGGTYGDLGGPNAGYTDVWLARCDSAGTQLWIRQFGTADGDEVWAAGLDGSGGVYVTGSTYGSLGGPSSGYLDAWLARYDGGGNEVWIRQLGTVDGDEAHAAAPDGSGGVYVSGWTAGNPRGTTGGSKDIWVARYGAPCGASTSYCTAKTTSTGCTPAIGSAGTPSKSGGPGTFDVTLSGTRPGKPCILFYSVETARNAAPFQGGFLCMQPPIRRTSVEISASSGECTSGTSKDFGAVLATAGFIDAGDVVRGEWWGRDTPGNPSLSDAIEFTVCP